MAGGLGNIYASDGYNWVVIWFEISNVGKETFVVSENDFRVTDETGRIYDVVYCEGLVGSIYPSERREGAVVFEIPEETKILDIKYRFESGVIATWTKNLATEAYEFRPEVTIEDVELKGYVSGGEYWITEIIMTVRNDGNAPVWIGDIYLEDDGYWKLAGWADVLLNEGEEKQITVSVFVGTYEVPKMVKIADEVDGKERVIATGKVKMFSNT